MKIQVSKQDMATLLHAMLSRNAAQQQAIDETLEVAKEVDEDSEKLGAALEKARRAIAALTGTELGSCGRADCNVGHLSKEAVRLCKEAMEGNSMYDCGFVAGHQKCTEQLTGLDKARREEIDNLQQRNDAQAEEMEARRKEIKRLKQAMVNAAGVYAQSQPQPEPERRTEVPGVYDIAADAELSMQSLKEQRSGTALVWGKTGADLLLRVMEGLARRAYGAGVLAERGRKAEAPQSVHVVVVAGANAYHGIYVYACNDDAVRRYRELCPLNPGVVYSEERVIPDSGYRLPPESGEEVVPMT